MGEVVVITKIGKKSLIEKEREADDKRYAGWAGASIGAIPSVASQLLAKSFAKGREKELSKGVIYDGLEEGLGKHLGPLTDVYGETNKDANLATTHGIDSFTGDTQKLLDKGIIDEATKNKIDEEVKKKRNGVPFKHISINDGTLTSESVAKEWAKLTSKLYNSNIGRHILNISSKLNTSTHPILGGIANSINTTVAANRGYREGTGEEYNKPLSYGINAAYTAAALPSIVHEYMNAHRGHSALKKIYGEAAPKGLNKLKASIIGTGLASLAVAPAGAYYLGKYFGKEKKNRDKV